MKKILIATAFIWCHILASGQYCYNFDEALVKSQTTGANILMVFAGSDWCKPCIQFKNEILESEAFKAYKDDFIILYLDFPYKKSNQLEASQLLHNETLAEIYNSKGVFPKIIQMDSNKAILNIIKYEKSMDVADFIHQTKLNQYEIK